MHRLYRRMSSSLGLHVPPNVLLLLKVNIIIQPLYIRGLFSCR